MNWYDFITGSLVLAFPEVVSCLSKIISLGLCSLKHIDCKKMDGKRKTECNLFPLQCQNYIVFSTFCTQIEARNYPQFPNHYLYSTTKLEAGSEKGLFGG